MPVTVALYVALADLTVAEATNYDRKFGDKEDYFCNS